MNAPSIPLEDPRRGPLRWVLLIVFAVLLGIMLAAGMAGLNGLHKIYAQQQTVRHAFAERGTGISNLCLSVQVYNLTARGRRFLGRYARQTRRPLRRDSLRRRSTGGRQSFRRNAAARLHPRSGGAASKRSTRTAATARFSPRSNLNRSKGSCSNGRATPTPGMRQRIRSR